MRRNTNRGRARRAAAALSATGLLAAALQMSAATPAQAGGPGTCVTKGHAYLIHGGRAYFSGYDGVNTGTPRLVVSQGEMIELGGNGIEPASGVEFEAAKFPSPGLDLPSGTIPFGPQPGRQTYQTLGARANCVVHQEGPYPITAPPGKYRILTQFRPGNWTGGSVRTTVVDLEVLPGLPRLNSTSAAAQDASTASEATDLVGLTPSGSNPGGGGTDPDPCASNPQIECPIGPLTS
jgi:hypothetical protein